MRIVGLAFLLVAGTALGQAKPAAPSGTGVGHVRLADTGRPASFASVSVLQAPDPSGETQSNATVPNRVLLVDSWTEQDGSFRFTALTPGDYYVMANMPGYIIPALNLTGPQDGRDAAKLLAGVPLVHVQADKTANAEVTLRRGGAIVGQVRFKDSTPAAGVLVYVLSPGRIAQGYAIFSGFPALSEYLNRNRRFEKSTDEGMFRIAGLEPGKYLVNSQYFTGPGTRMISRVGGGYSFAGRGSTSMVMYMPGTMRPSEAKEIEVSAGQVAQADIEMNLGQLHSAQGTVLVRSDRHAPNWAWVTVRDMQDRNFARSGMLGPDGHWKIDYLPAGKYTVTVGGAQDVENPDAMSDALRKPLHQYADISEPLVIAGSDVTAEELLLEDAQAAPGNRPASLQ